MQMKAGKEKSIDPRRGAVVVAILAAISLLLWAGAMLARLMQNEILATISYRDGIAAQYLAEAGVRRALVVLYKGGNPAGLAENVHRHRLTGQYRITAASENGNLRIRSVGQAGAAKRSLSVLVKVSLEPAPGAPLTKVDVLRWEN